MRTGLPVFAVITEHKTTDGSNKSTSSLHLSTRKLGPCNQTFKKISSLAITPRVRRSAGFSTQEQWNHLSGEVKVCILVGALRALKRVVWFKSYQQHQIWSKCLPYHTLPISTDCQYGRSMGTAYWHNPKWPPAAANINTSFWTKFDTFINNTCTLRFLGSKNQIMMIF